MHEPHQYQRLVWLHGDIASPPLSSAARLKMGVLLRRVQGGESLGLPVSRPLPVIGPRCHELRVVEGGSSWRLVYRIDPEAVVIVDVFRKTTRSTPTSVIQSCKRRLGLYDRLPRALGRS
jgi:phage-related protein